MLHMHIASFSAALTSTRRTTASDLSVTQCATFTVRGGYTDLDTGSLRRTGNGGFYWSTTTYPNATYAYRLNFDNSNVDPSDYHGRFYGFSVRGGYTDLKNGSLRAAGLNTYYWSAATYPNAIFAYVLYFDKTDTNPSYCGNRFDGFSVSYVDFLWE